MDPASTQPTRLRAAPPYLSSTYFLNKSSHITTVNYNINQVDPRIALQYGAATNATVANPFYHLAIPNQSPGALWNQATVGVTTLARPYPQYGGLTVIDGISGGDMTYHSLQLKATKSFSNGYTLLVGYNYHVQANQSFYDNVDNYLKNWTSLDSATPRHRITGAGTWALPVGKGRKLMNGAPRLLDALIGGWNLAGLMTYHSGTLLNFGGMLVTGDPHIANPGPNAWFDKSVFKQLPACTGIGERKPSATAGFGGDTSPRTGCCKFPISSLRSDHMVTGR